MTRPAKSQWQFGELFPQETGRRILSVTELSVQIKRLLEKQYGQVWVSGEVTNLRVHTRHKCHTHTQVSVLNGA